MSTIQDYEYSPLQDSENYIRLLKLLPPTPGRINDIRGELIACRFEDAPPYRPVSYAWGQQDASSTILLREGGVENCDCDGCRTEARVSRNAKTFSALASCSMELDTHAAECISTTWRKLPIRPNLEALLRRFNKLSGPKLYWIDAVCINQSDKEEKGYQVCHMDKIYRNRSLLIWLGEPTEDSDKAIDLMEAIQCAIANPFQGCTDSSVDLPLDASGRAEAAQNFAKKFRDTSSQKAFNNLVRRPWFTRRWIVQEYVLSKHKHAYIGDRGFCFQYTTWLKPECLHLGENEVEDSMCRGTSESGEVYQHGFPGPLIDPIDNVNRLWDCYRAAGSGDIEALTLERLLDKFASLESSDPRDGIYAFLSMASDIDSSDWIPDYSDNNTATDIYSKAVLHIMQSSHCLDIICRRIHSRRHALSVSHLSRWVPWFGLQEVEFRPGHSHSINGYNSKSLTTFGQPLSTLREGQTGYLPLDMTDNRRICKGCKRRINGTGYKCLECPDCDYCHRCISEGASYHNASHRFEIFNKGVYFASNYTRHSVDPSLRMFPRKSSIHGDLPLLEAAGFLADSIQGIEEPSDSEITRYARGSHFLIPLWKWLYLAGPKRMGLGDDGLLGYNFFRALTGNRRVIDGRVCHIPDDDLHSLRKKFSEIGTKPIWFDDQYKLEESVNLMLSNSRRFATTESSLGFVPVNTQVGDRIAIIIGCSVPVVIRELGITPSGPRWMLIGECYIQGLMEGEFGEMAEDRGLSPQAITLL